MTPLTESDHTLISLAQDVIARNYDDLSGRHTVGAAVRCKDGKVYLGVNLYSIHGSCAEFVAIGAAIAAGEREFETIVSVRGGEKPEILSPCGNCRQMLLNYAPECSVIVVTNQGPAKVLAKELLPFAYMQP
ncbi:MAG: cytidine deaminase [Bacillota bacterium]